MIDSRATGNYISSATIARINIPFARIALYKLLVIDSTQINHNNRVITQGTISSKLVTKDRHTSEVQFDIALIRNHQTILRIPWLYEHNPEID